MAGINTGPEEVQASSLRLFQGAALRVSVIDVNDPSGRFERADDAERGRFLSALAEARISFVRRYSGGPDIHAACGMLAVEAQRRLASCRRREPWPRESAASGSADDPRAVAEAARILRDGGIVAFPTETVYGLGAYAFVAEAVARVFEVKRRPSFDPLIVHVPDLAAARRVVGDTDSHFDSLARAFWPGPLTLVLRRHPDIPDIVTSGLATVGVRVPAHRGALRLLEEAGIPLAAPSANPFGYVSPTTAAHVVDSLGESVDFVLDGGPCAVGVESTIVSLETDPPTLLRPGGIATGNHRGNPRHGALRSRLPRRVAGRPRLAGSARAVTMLRAHPSPCSLWVLVQRPRRLVRLGSGRWCSTKPRRAASPSSSVSAPTDATPRLPPASSRLCVASTPRAST